MAAFCSGCGREVTDNGACPQCGATMTVPPPPQRKSPAPVTPPSPAAPAKHYGIFAALAALGLGLMTGIGMPPAGAGLPKDEMPILHVNVDVLAQYSVALALLINVLGFIIAAYHYSRRGVSPTLIPIKLVWSAGFTFLILTAFYVHVGYETFRLMRSTVPAEANWYMGLAVLFTATLRRYFLTRMGAMIYIVPTMFVGAMWQRGWIEVRPVPLVTEHSFQLPLPAVALVFGFGLVLAYARLVYPVLLRSVGGGAYQPVVLTLSDDYSALLSNGAHVYEVLATSDSLYLAVERIRHHSKRPPFFSGPYTWRNWHTLESTRYIQLPRSAAKCVEYTDPMELARPVGTGEPQATLGEPRTPDPLLQDEGPPATPHQT